MFKNKSIFLEKRQLQRLLETFGQDNVSVFDLYCRNYQPANAIEDWYSGKPQPWAPLINPHTYQKALEEYTRYGQFVRFPEDLPYKMLSTIMRNAAILEANTLWRVVPDNSKLFKEAQKSLLPFLKEDGYTIYERDCRGVKVPSIGRLMSFDSVLDVFKEKISTDHWGIEQIVDYWEVSGLKISFSEFISSLSASFVKQMPSLADLINSILKFGTYIYRIDVLDNGLFVDGSSKETMSVYSYLLTKGFFTFLKRGAPQGSGLYFSAEGLHQLKPILDAYKPSMSPEEVLVLVNRALDVTHDRGSLAEVFIQGGAESLDAISHSNKSGKFPQYGEQPAWIDYDWGVDS